MDSKFRYPVHNSPPPRPTLLSQINKFDFLTANVAKTNLDINVTSKPTTSKCPILSRFLFKHWCTLFISLGARGGAVG